jgi:hypothetical protein
MDDSTERRVLTNPKYMRTHLLPYVHKVDWNGKKCVVPLRKECKLEIM